MLPAPRSSSPARGISARPRRAPAGSPSRIAATQKNNHEIRLTHPLAGNVGLDVAVVRGDPRRGVGGVAEVVETAVVVPRADGVRKVERHRGKGQGGVLRGLTKR